MLWNPRYVAYAWAHGNTPARQLDLDKDRWPGGCMSGFLTWNAQRLAEFRKVSPGSFVCDALCDHPAYDAWLLGTAPCDAAVA